MSTLEKLQKIAEFDHPFIVTADGNVQDGPADVHAPEVYNDETADVEIMGAGWTALTGYTGQYGYRGAVLHPSEFIGGGLAEDILDNPGVYVIVVVEGVPRTTFPHEWSPSGARCVRSGCNLVGAGPGDGSCELHPDYDVDLVDDDEDPEPAGWAVLRLDEPEVYTLADEGTIDGVRYVTVLDAGGNPMEYNIPATDAYARYRRELEPTTCQHCNRRIEKRADGWACPDADNSDDDPYQCEDHETFVADHEPA